MIPLRDNIPSSRRPYASYALIGVNVLFFFFELSLGPHLPRAIHLFGFTPSHFLNDLYQGSVALAVIPIFTSMFLHAGWLHLIGNMWTLFIFGDNVEDVMGRGQFLFFYLACGLAALVPHVLFAPNSATPLVGASGAIAGVMGAYFSLYPGARVLTLVPIFIVFTVIELPAYVFLGFWFVLQFFQGAFSIFGVGGGEGGVAWWAHVGGFVAGAGLIRLIAPERVRKILSTF
ncbi:MAG: rhomboid family intramembrane serine protease [Syntrophales bacterium]|nr:rhomboid family intramembrane serine protease [Syntrophales bacterium]MDD5640704.1 rhomboid family intramembrane serine protease [Syntrophales bacterium]